MRCNALEARMMIDGLTAQNDHSSLQVHCALQADSGFDVVIGGSASRCNRGRPWFSNGAKRQLLKHAWYMLLRCTTGASKRAFTTAVDGASEASSSAFVQACFQLVSGRVQYGASWVRPMRARRCTAVLQRIPALPLFHPRWTADVCALNTLWCRTHFRLAKTWTSASAAALRHRCCCYPDAGYGLAAVL